MLYTKLHETAKPLPLSGKADTGFRSDIQGLRAVAISLVLLFHAGVPFLTGGFVGVDVFFVISGYLITGLLLRDLRGTGRISLAEFYCRRIRRILPAATVVLVGVSVMTVTILPRTRWADTARQIVGSAIYLVNWILADSVNYLNADEPPTAVQHFWTLAVEEQFYIIWPLVLFVLLLFVRLKGRRGQRLRAVTSGRESLLLKGILAITIPSLAWSLYYTATDASRAYFVTTTRLWELGIGAVIAVIAVQLRGLPHFVTMFLGWIGLGSILASGILYSSLTPFPGYAALMPTLGAGAIIVAGLPGSDGRGVGALLATRPLTRIGAISYSLYLWHWPLIVIASYLLGGLSLWQGLIVIAISFIPAYLSFRYVEKPILLSSRLRRSRADTFQLGASFMLLSILAGFVIILNPEPVSSVPYVAQASGGAANTAVNAHFGAELLADNPSVGTPTDTVDGLVLSAVAAANDVPALYQNGCQQQADETDAKACISGDANATFQVAVVGDSHAAQWVPAFDRLGSENGWRISSYTKSQCPFLGSAVVTSSGPDVKCVQWNVNVAAALIGAGRPDLVILSSSRYAAYTDQVPGAPVTGDVSDGLAYAYASLKNAGIPVAVLADTPMPEKNIPECVSANPNKLTSCAFSREDALQNGLEAQRTALTNVNGVPLIDLNDKICPEKMCSAVVGNVIVYRDGNHVTATYIRTLATALKESLVTFGLVPPVR